MTIPARKLLRDIFDAGLAAVDPATCLPPHLSLPRPLGRTLVAGAGKAAARMAMALASAFAGPVTGTVVTRYGHGLTAGERAPGIRIVEAAHPVPDSASVAAGAAILQLARSARREDRWIFLLSGGASSLLVQPAPGITLADKQAVTGHLLAAGADIAEINCVRRKLSAIKGGRLARAIAADEILLLALSDVPGDVVADIGSGPLSADPTTLADARGILARYRYTPGPAVETLLADPASESPSAGDEAFRRVTARLIGRSADVVAAAARAAGRAGFAPLLLPDVTGPARDVATGHAALIRDLVARGVPTALISGGETTVTVANPAGRGGRNGEYALALALELGPHAGVHGLAADTDGLDGSGDNAGVFIAPDTLARAAAAGLDAAGLLAANRSYDFFAALGDLVVTGPTRTNANDLRIVLAGGPAV